MYSFHSFETMEARDHLPDILDKIVPINQLGKIPIEKQIIVYGCGDLGRMCREFCFVENIAITTFIDANFNEVSQDPVWNNYEIQPMEYLKNLVKKDVLILVCIVNYPLREIFDQLQSLGFENVVTFYDFAEVTKNAYPLANGWFADPDCFDRGRITKATQFFDDDKSIKHYLSFIAWRFARNEWTFAEAEIENHNRFFIDEVKKHLSGKNVLVDVGAHFGSISIQFEDFLNKDLEKIYCFEPDRENRVRLSANLEDCVNPTSKYEIFDDVLWSSSHNIRFAEGFNYASSIVPHGNSRKSSTLDSFDFAPTILKIHTEGSELDIIKGSMKTIQTARPIVMLTVYHNSDGLYKTLEFLASNLEDYEYLFRMHSWAGTGAVLYCLPKKES